LPHWLGCGLAWLAMTSLQSLTVVSLKCRLVFLRLSKSWFWLLLILWVAFDIPFLWVAFDIPLVVSRQAYMVLPIAYGIAQASFLFDFRKAGQ
jgi:hypothetical protein